MIKFFRKIRQKLLSENKLRKYLVYAAGEIVLVVIGILIALSINNWNEDRKLHGIETLALKEINYNLIDSKNRINYVIQGHKSDIKFYTDLKNHIEKDLNYSVKLDTAFSKISNWYSPYLTYTAYESLKSKGIELVRNEDIRDRITKMYEYEFEYLTNDWDRYEWERASTVTFPFVEKYLRKDLETGLAKPNNYNELKNNEEFLNILHSNIWIRNEGIKRYSLVAMKIDTLTRMIEAEIK